jgi:hypothetical protein
MSKKKWALVLLFLLLSLGYYKLFFSKMNYNTVSKNADAIISVDVKKVIRTIAWDFITHPSKWKPSGSCDTCTAVDIKDIFELPDYLLAFHKLNEPLSTWYALLTIKDEALFEKGLVQFGFVKTSNNVYVNNDGVALKKHENKVLLCTKLIDNNLNIATEELFLKKEFIASSVLDKLKSANNHASFYFAKNNFLQQDAVGGLNITANNITIDGDFLPQSKFVFNENTFSYSSKSILSFGFTQPNSALYALLMPSDKANASKAIGFDIDQFLLQSNKYYQLNFDKILARTDSAITYTYDDDFNKVEKVIVNKVDEPMFNFVVKGDSVNNIFNYWKQNNNISVSDTGNYFRPMPFVKSYCSISNTNELVIAPKVTTLSNESDKQTAVLFAHIQFDKITEPYLKYLPNNLVTTINKFAYLHVNLTKQQALLQLNINALKSNNIKSLLDL